MARKRRRPAYSLAEAKELARKNALSINSRARRFIVNHTDWTSAVMAVRELIESTTETDFFESVELDQLEELRGTWADVYKVDFDGERWYLKFFIEEGHLRLGVLSANYDGYLH